LASQGETALVSMAISMALIENSLRKYNIILLDELDSTLDIRNKKDYINILEKQIELLNVEQIFIISHNKEFDSYPVDLILFEGHEMDLSDLNIVKKNILYKF